jgi:Fic family protein
MTSLNAFSKLVPDRFETPQVLKKLASASRSLAELKGVATSIPNQAILIDTFGMLEAKDSSAIENIIVTHDDLFREESHPELAVNSAVKEVVRYRQALRVGFESVQETGLITLNQIQRIQAELEGNNAGFRKVPGTMLKNGSGQVVYAPPQDPSEIVRLMGDLETFLNDPGRFPADPLVKMALSHYQFESIHPFYDGNGRTGRILNVLYLVKEGLLEIPALYMSMAIFRTKSDYYRLLQAVRERDAWEEWVVYMLDAVEQSALHGVTVVKAIREALLEAKHRIRDKHKFYGQILLNTLFTHPYVRIQHLERGLGVSRLTATKYLEALAADGLLVKRRGGRSNVYINVSLAEILTKS